jgi:hypothetical protein
MEPQRWTLRNANCFKELKTMCSRRHLLAASLVLLSFSAVAANRAGQNETKNKAVAERAFSEIWGNGDVDLIPQLFARDYHDNYPGTTDPACLRVEKHCRCRA